MNTIELAQYIESGRPAELELLGYLSKAAAELRRLAAVEAELATATAAGRAEAVVIIMSLSPEEDPLGDCIDCSGPNIDGEYDCSWNENKLLAKFEADAKHFQLLSRSDARSEVLYYDNVQQKQHIAELEAELEALRDQGPGAWQPLKTSQKGRDAVAAFFVDKLNRHDFTRYINNTLAADFACVLGGYLSSNHIAPQDSPVIDGHEWPEDRGEHPQRGLGVGS